MNLMFRGFLAFALVTTLYGPVVLDRQALAQELPPLYEDDPIELLPNQSIATFPINTFLESIVVDAKGVLFITNHEAGEILRLTSTGEPVVHATISGKANGLALAEDDSLIVSAWNAENVPTLFQIAADGSVTTLVTLPDAIFLNGLTQLSADRYLIADSYRGAIWELNTSAQTARVWLEHPLLARRTSESQTPGVNGLKIFAGILYASNSDQAHIVQIPIQSNGEPGEPNLFVQNTQVDDFAFDVEGNLYGATHVFNSVIKVAPDGSITTIAQDVVGSTAVAFGRTEADRTSLYIVTNGGMFLPPPTGVVPAQVARLEVDQQGWVPE